MAKLERFKETHGVGMTASELAKDMGGVLRAGVSQMLHRMMAKGFVTRQLEKSAPRKRKNGEAAGRVEAWRWTVTATGRKWL